MVLRCFERWGYATHRWDDSVVAAVAIHPKPSYVWNVVVEPIGRQSPFDNVMQYIANTVE